MYNPYGLDPWSKHYRKEALREVSKRQFAKRGRAEARVRHPTQKDGSLLAPASLLLIILALATIFFVASGSTVDSGEATTDHTASYTPSALTSTGSSTRNGTTMERGYE